MKINFKSEDFMKKKNGNFILLESLTCGGKGIQAKKIKMNLVSRGIPALIYSEPTSTNPIGITIRKIIERQPIEGSFIKNVFVPEVLGYIIALGASGVFLKGPAENDIVKKFAGTVNDAMMKVVEHKKLTNRELQSLYVADRHLNLRANIIPALHKGISVIEDRFDRSTMAFGEAFGGVTIEEVYRWHLHAIGEEYVSPDYDFFIRIKPETAMTRLQKDGKVKDQFEQKLDGLERTAAAYEKANLFMNKQYELQNPPRNPVIIINGEKNEDKVFNEIMSHISI
jgi:thymidylate kinase